MGGTVSKPPVVPGACNGSPALCSRLWSEVSHVGTHDSAFVGPLPTMNQDLSVKDQLDSGIRFLQAQSHELAGTLYMCHTTCLELNAGPVTDYLSSIKTWMDGNPDEVVTLLLTNADHVPVKMYGDVMANTGLAKYAYIPPKKLAISEWPTLEQLIMANTRLVMFLDNSADTSVVPYVLDEFSYFFETAFENIDKDFPDCSLNRPSGSNGDGLMYIVNHILQFRLFNSNVLVPNEALLYRTNAPTGKGSIGDQVDLCKAKWGRKPNFVLVDRFNRGNVFPAQNALNGL